MQNKLSGTTLDGICLLVCPAFSLQCANASVPSSGTARKNLTKNWSSGLSLLNTGDPVSPETPPFYLIHSFFISSTPWGVPAILACWNTQELYSLYYRYLPGAGDRGDRKAEEERKWQYAICQIEECCFQVQWLEEKFDLAKILSYCICMLCNLSSRETEKKKSQNIFAISPMLSLQKWIIRLPFIESYFPIMYY